MRFIILPIILFCSSVLADPGFYNPNDPNLPDGLRKAADSVFEIRTAFFEDYDNYSDISIVDVSSPSAMQSVLNDISAKDIDPKTKIILRAFIGKCKTPEEKASCVIPHKINSGSSFITGNGSTLWTNAHVMEKAIRTKARTYDRTVQEVLDTRDTLPVFIFDKYGNLVFNGLETPVSFSVRPPQTILTKAQGNFYAVDSDYLALKLPNSLGAPLSVAQTIESNDVAVIGYPSCTGCSATAGEEMAVDRYPFPNAEDCEEKLSAGQLMLPEQWGELAQVNQHLIQALDRRTFIAHDADTTYGMSGGPILNEKGEVVGINTGGKLRRGGDRIQVFGRGVRPLELVRGM